MDERQPRSGQPPELRFQDGLIPAVVQDVETGQVLMLAYMNEESLRRTLAERRTWFWSRSRQALWPKGETSGNVQQVVSVTLDCDGDALLVKVRQQGTGACHEGDFSCFHYPVELPAPAPVPPSASSGEGSRERPGAEEDEPREAGGDPDGAEILAELWQVIGERKQHPAPESYTSRLFEQGVARIAQKVGEEAVETAIEAVRGNPGGVAYEAADLIYHLLVLLAASGISPRQVFAELRSRRR